MSSILLLITPVSKCIFRNRIYLVLTQHLLMSFLNVNVIKLLKSYTSTCTSQSSSVLCRTQTYCFVFNSKITAPQVIYSNSHICFDELSTLPPNHSIACNISLMIIYVPWRQGSFAACVSWQGFMYVYQWSHEARTVYQLQNSWFSLYTFTCTYVFKLVTKNQRRRSLRGEPSWDIRIVDNRHWLHIIYPLIQSDISGHNISVSN